LYPAGLNVSLNTDNRLIGGTTMTGEFELALRFLGLELDDLRKITQRSIDAAFCDEATKAALIQKVEAAYATTSES
jgi:adenosine deaminase